jgi:cell division protein FtsQ
VTAAVVGAGTGLWTSGTVPAALDGLHGALMEITAATGFSVEEVLVTGRRTVDREAILAALGVERGDPILDFDPAAAQQAIQALPGIRSAAVERRLPDTIFVHLEERAPMAIWQSDQRLSLIDRDGNVLSEHGVEAFPDLPMVVGTDARETAAALLDSLALAPAINSRVEVAIRVGGRRWDLRLDNGITVQLPEEGQDAALARLAALQEADQVLDRDIVGIDLRLADRALIQLTPEAAARRGAPEENT